MSWRVGVAPNGSALAEVAGNTCPARRYVYLLPFAQTNRVPTAVPNLFLVSTAATHCDYSLVPSVPTVPYV